MTRNIQYVAAIFAVLFLASSAIAGDDELSAAGDNELSAAGDDEPSAAGDNEPSAAGDNEPSAAGDDELSAAGDNQLSAEETKAGWQLLFNGRDLTGWKCNNGKPIATPVEKGSLVPYESGGYLIVNENRFANFVLKCDVRWEDPRCNSGIFFRVEDPENPVNTGFEIQVMSGTKVGKHEFGAIYDLEATTKNAGKKTGEWNTVEIRCQGPYINVNVNGEKVAAMNCDKFDQPGVCPDGTKHKYSLDGKPRAVKDFARTGLLGFQDHGHKVWYKNVKLLELDLKE